MLNDDDGIVAIAQFAQHGDEPFVVARMEPDGRFVKDIQHARQAAADLRREANALHLAARER